MSIFGRRVEAEMRPQSIIDLDQTARMWYARAWSKDTWVIRNPLKVSYREAIVNSGFSFADPEARFFVEPLPSGVWIDPNDGSVTIRVEWTRRNR